MHGKKKKGKKKEVGKKIEPTNIILPNFVPIKHNKNPLAIHIHHLNDRFLIYTDEYEESSKLIEAIGKILNIESCNLRLYFSNKRRIDPDTVNHDQQILHNINLYLTIKNDGQWENIKDILDYNIYEIDLESILNKENEEKKLEEAKIIEEEKKKKELADKIMGEYRKNNSNTI